MPWCAQVMQIALQKQLPCHCQANSLHRSSLATGLGQMSRHGRFWNVDFQKNGHMMPQGTQGRIFQVHPNRSACLDHLRSFWTFQRAWHDVSLVRHVTCGGKPGASEWSKPVGLWQSRKGFLLAPFLPKPTSKRLERPEQLEITRLLAAGLLSGFEQQSYFNLHLTASLSCCTLTCYQIYRVRMKSSLGRCVFVRVNGEVDRNW